MLADQAAVVEALGRGGEVDQGIGAVARRHGRLEALRPEHSDCDLAPAIAQEPLDERVDERRLDVGQRPVRRHDSRRERRLYHHLAGRPLAAADGLVERLPRVRAGEGLRERIRSLLAPAHCYERVACR